MRISPSIRLLIVLPGLVLSGVACAPDTVAGDESSMPDAVFDIGLDSGEPAGDLAMVDSVGPDVSDVLIGDDEAAGPDTVDAGPAGPLSILAIEPSSGDASSSTTVTVRGSGLLAVTDVWFGRARSPSIFPISDTLLNCVAPPSRSGPVTVTVVDDRGRQAVSPIDFVYTSALDILSVTPASGTAAGGTPVSIAGSGFLSGPEVFFDDRPAISVTVVSDDTILAVTPPGVPGTVAVRAVSPEGDVTAAGVWTYLPEEIGPTLPGVRVAAVSPDSGPSTGGRRIVVVGEGFFEGMSVKVGPLPCSGVRVLSSTMLEAITPPGTPGAADVSVAYRYASSILKNGYFYQGADGGSAGIFALNPPDASWAGGSLVSVRGFGLSGVDTVWFGQFAGEIVSRVSDFELVVRTPRVDDASTVFVMALGRSAALLQDGFRFYDPYMYGGGVRGRPIFRDLQVTVYDGSTGLRLQDAFVVIGADMHTPWQGRTDVRGQITFAGMDLKGPVDVSATKLGYTAYTYAGISGRDVTFSIYTTPPPETPTEPQPGEPSKTCTLSGRVRDFGKYFIKPLWLDGTAWVECFTSTSSMYTSMSTIPETNRPDQDGRFVIPARNGEFAVICRLMALETGMQVPYPLRMGVARHVRCIDGVTPEVEVSLDIPTESQVRFGILDAPTHPLGTWDPRVTGGWHLGSDGYLPLPVRGTWDGSSMVFDHQPDNLEGDGIDDLAGSGYDLYVTISSRDQSGMPYSVVQVTGLMPPVDGAVLTGTVPGLSIAATSLSRTMTTFRRLSDGSGLALDESGRTWEFDDTGFRAGRNAFGFKLWDLVGDSSEDFTAVGTRGRIVEVRDGTAEIVQTQFVVDFFSIDGQVDGVQSIAAGNFLLRRQDGVVTVEDVPAGAVMRVVRRFDDGTVFAAGPQGLIVTGVSGSELAAVRPVAEDIYAIAGSSSSRVWMAGANGRVLSILDGDVTVLKTPGSENLRGILELGECDVLFFGDSGAIYRFDCFRFHDVSDRDSMPWGITAGIVLDRDAGTVAMVSSPVSMLAPFAGFPTIVEPSEGGVMTGSLVWASGAEWGASYCQGLVSGLTGSTAWQFLSEGGLPGITLPDFERAIGYHPLAAGPKRMNLTCSRTPRFDMGNFDYRSLSVGNRETYSVDLVSFF